MAILTAGALPTFTNIMKQSSIKNTRQSLLQDIRLLRSYARTRHAAAYLCANRAENGCIGTKHWKNGWFGFLDHNQTRQFDEGDEIVVAHQPATRYPIDVTIHTRWQKINIDQQGIIRSSGHFRICDASKPGVRDMKVIRMNVHGRLRVESDKLDCTLKN